MRVVYGNLIQMALYGEFDIIIHGCNCFCVMGAGFAKQIREHYAEAYLADQQTARGSKNKLGTISWATCHRGLHDITVVNAYTQYGYGSGEQHTDYTAIRRAFREVAKKFHGKRIAYPAIGAGLGGGKWSTISKIIDEELQGENHTLVKFKRL
jgi:O-acetyl-ADP-ribose deacetylase (regulator of RNase III)